MRKVEVKAYNHQWPAIFTADAKKLQVIFGSELLEIHHIGSTSIKGLAAKPVIDIMPVAERINQIDSFNSLMESNGYEAKGENGIPGRRFFQKGESKRTHHIHIFETKSPHIERHLAFRDYLRTYPGEALAYGSLKKQLAQMLPYDMKSYINGKAAFIANTEQEALTWYRSKSR